jgi:hypothetical protein
MSMGRPARPFALLFALAAAGLSACAGEFNPVRDAAVSVGAGAERKAGPDFVSGSRPANLEYAPVGAKPPQREKAKPIATVKQVEAEMDALRAANEAKAREAQQAGAALATPPAPAAPAR